MDKGDDALGPPAGQPGYDNWLDAARGGNLASYAWANRPAMSDLVPGYSPAEGLGQKVLDYGSLPARLLTNAVVRGEAP